MDSVLRLGAFRRLFGGNPLEATDEDVDTLLQNLAPTGEEFVELGSEIEERINSFFDDPIAYLESQDEEVQKKLRLLGANNRSLFIGLQNIVPVQGEDPPPDPFTDHVPEEPEVEPPRPREPRVPRSRVLEAELPRRPESEEPEEEERIPAIVEITLRSIDHAYPFLKRARMRDEWPEMRDAIEQEANLLRFSFSVRTWAAARSVHTDVVDAADAYVTTLLGGFSHPSFAPAAYKSAWRLAVGHLHHEP